MGFSIFSWPCMASKDSSPVVEKTNDLNSDKRRLDKDVDQLSRGIHQKLTESMKNTDNALIAAREWRERDAKYAALYPPKK